MELPALKGDIVFSDVHFAYGDGAPVLQGLDLQNRGRGAGGHRRPEREREVDRGHVGLTVLRTRTTGSVLVDGHDVRGVTLDSLRRQIGVVFDDSFLFSDTVRSNIAYGRPDASERGD